MTAKAECCPRNALSHGRRVSDGHPGSLGGGGHLGHRLRPGRAQRGGEGAPGGPGGHAAHRPPALRLRSGRRSTEGRRSSVL